MADFDRSQPLFERSRVPCEFIAPCGGGSGGAGRISGHHSLSSSAVNNRGGSGRTVHYTVRILSGRRQLRGGGGGGGGGNGGGGGSSSFERCIRFEISDECSHHSPQSRLPPPPPNNDGSGGGGTTMAFASPPPAYGSGSGSGGGPTPPVVMQLQQQMGAAVGPPAMQAQHQQQHRPASNHRTNSLSAMPVPSVPVHLYELEVGETDFADLRRDQALLVDFADFAESFVALLGYCDLGEEQDEGTATDGRRQQQQQQQRPPRMGSPPPPHTPYSAQAPRYTCRLEDLAPPSSASGDGSAKYGASWDSRGGGRGGRQTTPGMQARFSIVESNQFRELTHLSLNLTGGTDASVRAYLSSRLYQTMADNSCLRYDLMCQIGRAESAERSAGESNGRFNELIATAEAERRALKLEADETMQRDRTRQDEEHRIAMDEKEEAGRRVEAELERTRAEMETKVGGFEARLGQAHSARDAAEAGNKDLRVALDEREGTIQSLTADLESARDELRAASDDKGRIEKVLHQTQTRVDSLAKSNESQERALGRSDELRRSAEVGSAAAADSLGDLKGQLERALVRTAELETEIATGREVIAKYKQDRQEMKRRMKGRSDMVRRQEEVLTEKEGEVAEVRRRLDETELDLRGVRSKKEAAERELVGARDELAENAKTLESNQQVIAFLNKGISGSSHQLGRSHGHHRPSVHVGAGSYGTAASSACAPYPAPYSTSSSTYSGAPSSLYPFRPLHLESYVTPDLKGSGTNKFSTRSVPVPVPVPVPQPGGPYAVADVHQFPAPAPAPAPAAGNAKEKLDTGPDEGVKMGVT